MTDSELSLGDKMKDIEKFKEEVETFCKNKFSIFYGEPLDEEKNNIVSWQGDNYKEFLLLAEKFSPNILYIMTGIWDDAEDSTYNGKICLVELGFYYNDIFHLFKKETEWFSEKVKDTDETEDVPKDIIEKPAEALSGEMIDFIKKEYSEIYEGKARGKRDFIQARDSFWLYKGLGNKWGLDMNYVLKLRGQNTSLKNKLEKM